MKNIVLIGPDGLDFLRAKFSDHLILDWFQLQQAGLDEFKIMDMDRVLGIPRSCSKHKIEGLIKAGLVVKDRMESVHRIYKLVPSEYVGVFNARV